MEPEYTDPAAEPVAQPAGKPEPTEQDKKLAAKILARIDKDRKKFAKAFERMREDMYMARTGAPKSWKNGYYTANIAGRHVMQKTASLYARNPKAVARRDRLDFKVWDENVQTLEQSLQLVMQMQKVQATPDPVTGAPTAIPPAMAGVLQQAMAVVQDYEQGMTRRQQVEKIGRTLELLFDYYTKEQTPVDFKTSMKQLVRRATTCGVAYCEIGFQREMDTDPQVTQRISDFSEQMRMLEHRAREVDAADEQDDTEVKKREIELTLASLQQQQYVLVREGLVFDFPDSTSVIPDSMCRNLTGFVGARWITVQYLYTVEEVEAKFQCKLGKDYKAYDERGILVDDDQPQLDLDDAEERKGDLVCVYKHYDKQAGLVYLVCDGYKGFLREPTAPDVYVEDFWPVYALTFNEVEDPCELFPPSDVRLMVSMVLEYLSARQGQSEHRKAARPRFVTFKGMMDDEDKAKLNGAEPFTVAELNGTGEQDIGRMLQAVQIPGVDPNLYETNQFMTDIQLTVGAQEAQFGAVAKATATESSIAEGSRIASVDSNVDDLDGFLTRIARSAGQIMLRELSPQTVMEIAGEGAVWPQLTLDQIAKELYLEIEAGSSGKPNQAQEMANWEKMLPFLLQMPGITPMWLARETLRRLDDRMDLTQALTENIPSIIAMNGAQQPTPADPAADPQAQGPEGANNAPAPPGGPAGSDAPMGNNQV